MDVAPPEYGNVAVTVPIACPAVRSRTVQLNQVSGGIVGFSTSGSSQPAVGGTTRRTSCSLRSTRPVRTGESAVRLDGSRRGTRVASRGTARRRVGRWIKGPRQSHPERSGPHLSRGDELRLADIVDAAEQLGELVTDGRAAFDADWTRQQAAERMLEIIGEAANALSEEHRAQYPKVPWPRSFGTHPSQASGSRRLAGMSRLAWRSRQTSTEVSRSK